MKNLAISAVCLAVLTACGGGGGGTTQPTPAPGPISTASTGVALTLAKAFLGSYDTSLATAIPATGATALALNDGCSLNNGASKALAVSDYDADTLRVASRQFEVGSVRSAISVTADRTITNANNTVRREIDVQYAIDYLDGTKDEKATQTLITGSSAGSTLADGSACAASQDSADLRFFGNRKIANTFVNASNEKLDRSFLATGLALTPPLAYNRFITLGVRDPAKIATYATISGPGLTSAPGVPATFKMISPRLLRDDALFAGKNGNFVDWRDTDTFRVCRTSTGTFAAADVADCVTNGATGASWGNFVATDPAVQDAAFNALGVTAGGVYTVKLYAGIGWKTVNGQATETPIASYTSTLENLPMSTVALASTAAVPGKFPELLTSSVTTANVAANVTAKAAFSTNLTWAAPGVLPDARKTGLSALYSFEQGRASTGTAFNPASRQTTLSFPASTALLATFNVPAPVTALVTPLYFEAGLEYSNRNGNFIRNLRTFQ